LYQRIACRARASRSDLGYDSVLFFQAEFRAAFWISNTAVKVHRENRKVGTHISGGNEKVTKGIRNEDKNFISHPQLLGLEW
jgi:hypothetical protein